MAWWLTTVKRSITSPRPLMPGTSADGRASPPRGQGRSRVAPPCTLSSHPSGIDKTSSEEHCFRHLSLFCYKIDLSGYTAVRIVLTHVQVHVTTITIRTGNRSVTRPPPNKVLFRYLFTVTPSLYEEPWPTARLSSVDKPPSWLRLKWQWTGVRATAGAVPAWRSSPGLQTTKSSFHSQPTGSSPQHAPP